MVSREPPPKVSLSRGGQPAVRAPWLGSGVNGGARVGASRPWPRGRGGERVREAFAEAPLSRKNLGVGDPRRAWVLPEDVGPLQDPRGHPIPTYCGGSQSLVGEGVGGPCGRVPLRSPQMPIEIHRPSPCGCPTLPSSLQVCRTPSAREGRVARNLEEEGPQD